MELEELRAKLLAWKERQNSLIETEKTTQPTQNPKVSQPKYPPQRDSKPTFTHLKQATTSSSLKISQEETTTEFKVDEPELVSSSSYGIEEELQNWDDSQPQTQDDGDIIPVDEFDDILEDSSEEKEE